MMVSIVSNLGHAAEEMAAGPVMGPLLAHRIQ